MNRNRRICACLIITLVVSLLSLGVSFADNASVDKLNDLNQQIKKLEQQLKAGKSQEKNLTLEISKLDKLIKAAEGEIQELQGEISVTGQKVNTAKAQLAVLQAEMDEQNDDMGQRIRAMYKNGDVGILEVLLGSNDFTDFMINLDMAQKIYDNDVEVLERLEERHKVLDKYRQDLEDLEAELARKRQMEAQKQNQLQGSRGSVTELKANVAKDNKALEAQVDSLVEAANKLVAEIIALQGTGAYIGGKMAWPVPASTRITSQFGYRIHPILKVSKLHTGIDIGVPTGSNIVAANAGKVIRAAWNNSYGYMIIVDHGGGIATLYAHNSKLLVANGDIVTRGQVIAKAGSTGMSTGSHLHFEVRVNGEYKNPMGYFK